MTSLTTSSPSSTTSMRIHRVVRVTFRLDDEVEVTVNDGNRAPFFEEGLNTHPVDG